MGASPEAGLVAWVEYLRDMGVYDLYRRESPAVTLPAELVEGIRSASRLRAEPSAPANATRPLVAAQVPVSLRRKQGPLCQQPSGARRQPQDRPSCRLPGPRWLSLHEPTSIRNRQEGVS